MPNILTNLAAPLPAKFVGMMIIGNILFLLYILRDLFFLVRKRHFGRINIDLMHFTRNDNSKEQTDELIFRTVDGPIFLRQAYDSDFLFWKVISRSMRAKFDDPVVTFGEHYYAALVLFRERVSSKCAPGHFKRLCGLPHEKIDCWLVMVDEQLKSKKRSILKALLIRDEDLKRIDEYIKNPPSEKSARNFELFVKIAQTFQKNPEAFLDVEVVV